MKLLPILTLTALLASPLATFAATDKNGDGVVTKKEAKVAARAALAPSVDLNIPKELRAPRMDRRIEKMRLLIVQGIEAGQITAVEAGALERELSRVARQLYLYTRGSNLSPAERSDVSRDINRLHENIWKKTHNGEKPAEPLDK